MANGKKPARDELKNLQEDLGPYFQQPLLPRRSAHSREASLSEPRHQLSHTPEPKRSGSKRQDPSSRDSTPNRPTKSRSKELRGNIASNTSTPRRSPKAEPTPHSIPRADSVKPERSSRDMSQRNRSGRGSNRNNGNTIGEEAQIWEQCKREVSDIVGGINAENDSLADLVAMDKQVGAMESEKIPAESLQQMEQLCRSGVKHSEANTTALKSMIDQLKILRAVVVAKEQSESQSAGPGKRQARDSAATSTSLYDFDGAGDSPVPSPIGGGSSSRKYGDRSRDRDRDRDSMPPKADSVEPQGSVGSGVGLNNKSKVVFSRGDAVAFKPRPMSNGEQGTDWILGEVAQVMGEGKSRRYKVLDIEPEDQSKQKEYRSSASNMISIAPESQASSLKEWEAGKIVLALYPNTTTFYKAEVDSMTDGKVNLKFEGENDSTTLQQVERRFVIEYRA